MPDLWLGILLGLGAATAQSVSYLFSRQFTTGRSRLAPMRLWAMSHVIQGAVSLPAAWLLWPADLPHWSQWWLPVLGAGGFYALGQFGLFWSLRHTDASRVSALLGIKIPILAVIAVLVLSEPINAVQWVAVGLAVGAAFILNYTGGSLRALAIVAISITCCGYALSDVSIGRMIDAMLPVPPLHAGVFGTAVTYVLCGSISLAALPWLGSRRLSEWRAATPYALTWLTAMAFLFTCFGLVGVVFGNILQSTRGVISIVLGATLAMRGHLHLETRVSRGVFWRRLVGAAAMGGAIALYVLAKR